METTENHHKEKEDDALSFLTELPKVSPRGEPELLNWKGFWVMPSIIKAVVAMETQFEPHPSDIILVSFPKTGTTWLKALTVAILNYHKSKQNPDEDPLLTKNPHQLVPFLELECFGEQPKFDIREQTSSPRVFNTHLPHSVLPQNIKDSGCKIIYITRNPMDTFISRWHFFYQKCNSDVTIEEAFADFCKGTIRSGPYFDHVLEYWRVCNERPETLFLTYEALKQEPCVQVKRLADFLGYSMHPTEIKQVVENCSIERLSNLPVNKENSGAHFTGWEFSAFFRRGIVGDSKNYLTPGKAEQLREVAMQKWESSGLKFQTVDEILGLSE